MFPKQATYIIGTEACERFSYYGMKGILAGYMSGVLLMGGAETTNLLHFFMAFNYITPLLGGWLADRFWGRYHTILWISLLYCLGHALLAFADFSHFGWFQGFMESGTMQGIFSMLRGGIIPADASDAISWKTFCLLTGLTLIALGSGGIKPCVSSFMGDQFDGSRESEIRKAYSAFYWAINLGSFFSFLVIPAVKDSHGYGWAFAIPGLLMGLATFIFWLGRRSYVRVAPKKSTSGEAGFFRVTGCCLAGMLSRKTSGADKLPEGAARFWSPAYARYEAQSVDSARSVMRVLAVFSMVPPFWALFDQTGTTWVLQGKQMANLEIPVPGLDAPFAVTAETIQSANPLMVMGLIPLLTILVYPRLTRWTTPLRRMGVGIFLAAVSFAIVGWLQSRIEAGETLNIAWQVFPYIVLTLGEVLLSTTGLEFAFTQAGKAMKSTIMSFWVLTVAIGNLLVPLINMLTQSLGVGAEGTPVTAAQFFVYAGLVGIVAVAFAAVASRYKYRNVLAEA